MYRLILRGISYILAGGEANFYALIPTMNSGPPVVWAADVHIRSSPRKGAPDICPGWIEYSFLGKRNPDKLAGRPSRNNQNVIDNVVSHA